MPESGRQDAQSINKSKIMSRNIWLDGKIVDESDAKISVFDHGLLYGDGIFEAFVFTTAESFV